jgi:hypothetical protein
VTRQRSGSVHQHKKTQFIPNASFAPHGDLNQVFKPEDLAKKLQNVMSETSLSLPASNMRFQQHQQFQPQLNKLSRSVSNNSRPLDDSQHTTPASSFASPAPRLKPKRSFHEPELGHRARDAVSSRDLLPPHKRSMSVGRGDRERTSHRGQKDPVPPLPNTTPHGRTSLDDHRDRGRRVLVKPKVASSSDLERLQHGIHDTPAVGVEGVATSTRRIFIHSLQHSQMVDIGMDTSAGCLISSLETEGVLDGWAGIGGWTIWEIAQDFGMGTAPFFYLCVFPVFNSEFF